MFPLRFRPRQRCSRKSIMNFSFQPLHSLLILAVASTTIVYLPTSQIRTHVAANRAYAKLRMRQGHGACVIFQTHTFNLEGGYELYGFKCPLGVLCLNTVWPG